MYHSLVASVAAIFWSVVYARRLRLSLTESLHFVRKSANLGLCYGAFTIPTPSTSSAARAGLAAFCCAAYDVVTDWKDFARVESAEYFKILRKRVPRWAADMTEDLYQKELMNEVATDGLERGVIAIKFVTGLIGSRSSYETWDLARLGTLCQILDDVLDEPLDRVRSELNCLLSPRRDKYLQFFISAYPDLLDLFGSNPVMVHVLRTAACTARQLRSPN